MATTRIACMLLLVACGKSDSPAPAPTPTAADPLGPCMKLEGKTCLVRDPLFAETSQAPVIALPVETKPVKKYVGRVTARNATEIAIEAIGDGAIDVTRWEEHDGAWSVSKDTFKPAAAGAAWSTTFMPVADEQRIAIVGASEFRVRIGVKQ